MADDPNLLNKILDAVTDSLAHAWAFITHPMETTAAKTAWAYWKIMLAGTVKMFPALAVFMSGQTAIAPELVRKPDEHLQSQSQTTDTTFGGANLMEAATVSAVSLPIGRGLVEDPPVARLPKQQPQQDQHEAPLPLTDSVHPKD